MTALAKKGKNFTIRVFASILLISIYTIVTYNLVIENVETEKIIQQIVRFCLTVVLMYFIFKGKKWAVIVFTILFSIAILTALFTLLADLPFWNKMPLLVMTVIYGIAIYHLNFSKSFKEYLNYLQYKQ